MPRSPSSNYNYNCKLCKNPFKSQKPELASEDLVCRKCKTATNPCTTEGCRNKAMKTTGGKCRKCTDTQHPCIIRACHNRVRVVNRTCKDCMQPRESYMLTGEDLYEMLDCNFSPDALQGVLLACRKTNKGTKALPVECLKTSAKEAKAALKHLGMMDPNGWNLERTVQNAEVHRKVSCLVTDPEALPDWCKRADPAFKTEFFRTVVWADDVQ